MGCGEGHQSRHESGIPTVYLECLLYKYLKRLDEKGEFVPSCAVAGGIALEDQVFKAIALAAPYVRAVCTGRATLTAGFPRNGLDLGVAK